MIPLLLAAKGLARALHAVWRDPETRALPVVAGVLILTGTLFYWRFEDWTFIESLYFCIVTLTTVGYGDLSDDRRDADLHDRLHPHGLRRARRPADLGRAAIPEAQDGASPRTDTEARPPTPRRTDRGHPDQPNLKERSNGDWTRSTDRAGLR